MARGNRYKLQHWKFQLGCKENKISSEWYSPGTRPRLHPSDFLNNCKKPWATEKSALFWAEGWIRELQEVPQNLHLSVTLALPFEQPFACLSRIYFSQGTQRVTIWCCKSCLEDKLTDFNTYFTKTCIRSCLHDQTVTQEASACGQ